MVVYLIIMLADWMQGTHMYTLYLSYGVNVAALFLTGFLSGAIFAPFLGSAVDKFGRKKSCCVYCILEIIINTLEHSTNFEILLFGRVLGNGIFFPTVYRTNSYSFWITKISINSYSFLANILYTLHKFHLTKILYLFRNDTNNKW